MIALGRWDELRLHVQAALAEGGFSADALKEIVLQQRGLEGAKDVATLPEPEQHALVASIIRRETGVMAASAAVVALLCLRAQGWL